jgi:hypothetical protein
LTAAYGEGLLSSGTLAHRLEVLFSSRLLDPSGLVSDLTLRDPPRSWTAAARAFAERLPWRARGAEPHRGEPPIVLALDWDGGQDELLVGRHPRCDVVLPAGDVSRHHARLNFRDGRWILRDLESTNGTTVNGQPVGRCVLQPGDDLVIGDYRLRID